MKRFLSIVALALPLVTVASARAEERRVVVVEREEAAGTVPNSYMLGSGLAVFGISYGAAAVVGSTSPRSEDRTLFVPLLGPWLDLANRPKCGTDAVCNDENTSKVLLVVDGVFQGLGALTVIGSFFTPEYRRERRAVEAGVKIVPARMGVGGNGLMAVGRF
jgi:hypothetical protein